MVSKNTLSRARLGALLIGRKSPSGDGIQTICAYMSRQTGRNSLDIPFSASLLTAKSESRIVRMLVHVPALGRRAPQPKARITAMPPEIENYNSDQGIFFFFSQFRCLSIQIPTLICSTLVNFTMTGSGPVGVHFSARRGLKLIKTSCVVFVAYERRLDARVREHDLIPDEGGMRFLAFLACLLWHFEPFLAKLNVPDGMQY